MVKPEPKPKPGRPAATGSSARRCESAADHIIYNGGGPYHAGRQAPGPAQQPRNPRARGLAVQGGPHAQDVEETMVPGACVPRLGPATLACRPRTPALACTADVVGQSQLLRRGRWQGARYDSAGRLHHLCAQLETRRLSSRLSAQPGCRLRREAQVHPLGHQRDRQPRLAAVDPALCPAPIVQGRRRRRQAGRQALHDVETVARPPRSHGWHGSRPRARTHAPPAATSHEPPAPPPAAPRHAISSLLFHAGPRRGASSSDPPPSRRARWARRRRCRSS